MADEEEEENHPVMEDDNEQKEEDDNTQEEEEQRSEQQDQHGNQTSTAEKGEEGETEERNNAREEERSEEEDQQGNQASTTEEGEEQQNGHDNAEEKHSEEKDQPTQQAHQAGEDEEETKESGEQLQNHEGDGADEQYSKDTKEQQGSASDQARAQYEREEELELSRKCEIRLRTNKRDDIPETLRTELKQTTGQHQKCLLFQLALAVAVSRDCSRKTLMELPIVMKDDGETSDMSLFGSDGIYSNRKFVSIQPPHPLHLAAKLNHNNVIATLLKMDMQVDAQDDSFRTALHHAAQQGSTDTLDTLIQHNANVNALTLSLKSPLFNAIENGQGAAAEKLLDAGADPRLQDDLGRSVVEVGKFKLPQDWYQKFFDRLKSDSENDHGTSPAEEFLQKKLESKSDAEFNDMVTRVN